MLKPIFKITTRIVVAIWIIWLGYNLITIRNDGIDWAVSTRMIFSAKNFCYDLYGVKVKSYVMTADQVSNLFKNNSIESPASWTYQADGKKEQLYYVIRIAGEGVLGQLLCRLPTGEKYKFIVSIDYDGSIKNIIIPCPSTIYDLGKKKMKISTRWTNLYFTR